MLKIYYYPFIEDYVFKYDAYEHYLQMDEYYFDYLYGYEYSVSMELVAEVED